MFTVSDDANKNKPSGPKQTNEGKAPFFVILPVCKNNVTKIVTFMKKCSKLGQDTVNMRCVGVMLLKVD